jgi:hypothetical protein
MIGTFGRKFLWGSIWAYDFEKCGLRRCPLILFHYDFE